MVFSEKAFERETKTLEKKIKKEKKQVEREVWHLSNQEFYSEEDALKAAREREKRCDGDEEGERKRGTGETKKRRAYTDGLPRKSGVCTLYYLFMYTLYYIIKYYEQKNDK